MNTQRDDLEPAVTYGENVLILRISSALPNQTHNAIMKGLSIAMRESLYMESLTPEERDSLAVLGELQLQIIPDPLMLMRL